MNANDVAFSRFVAAVRVVDKNDPVVGQCEPGGIAVIWMGLLVGVVGVDLYQAVALILVGVVAGRPVPGPIFKCSVFRGEGDCCPGARACIAPLPEHGAHVGASASKI